MNLGKSSVVRSLLIAFSLCCTASFAETLGDVLHEYYVPTPPRHIAAMEQRINGYAVLVEGDAFTIAYHRNDSSDSVHAPLYLLRYSKTQRHWQKGSLLKASALGGRVDCLGSTSAVYHVGRKFYIDTHLNPSAGCMLTLGDDLSFEKAHYGWYLGAFRTGMVIFHNSEVHFAPTHPMQISIYDPGKGSEKKIYPPVGDRERARYIDELSAEPPDEEWCRVNNSHCDTAQFSSEVEDLVIDEETHGVAFVAQFTTEGFGPKAEEKVGSREVVYIYRLLGDRIVHRELPVAEAEQLFGTYSLRELLARNMLNRIFSKSSLPLK